MKTFSSLTLAKQFFIAGGLITLTAMTAVGFFLTQLIADAVTHNSAAATALYVDSVIAPILPDLTTTEEVDETIQLVLDETLGQGALANRLISFRLWRGDGTVLYSNDTSLIGKRSPRMMILGQLSKEGWLPNLNWTATKILQAPSYRVSQFWKFTTQSTSHGLGRLSQSPSSTSMLSSSIRV